MRPGEFSARGLFRHAPLAYADSVSRYAIYRTFADPRWRRESGSSGGVHVTANRRTESGYQRSIEGCSHRNLRGVPERPSSPSTGSIRTDSPGSTCTGSLRGSRPTAPWSGPVWRPGPLITPVTDQLDRDHSRSRPREIRRRVELAFHARANSRPRPTTLDTVSGRWDRRDPVQLSPMAPFDPGNRYGWSEWGCSEGDRGPVSDGRRNPTILDPVWRSE